jgi:hypothetical protein
MQLAISVAIQTMVRYLPSIRRAAELWRNSGATVTAKKRSGRVNPGMMWNNPPIRIRSGTNSMVSVDID